MTPVRYSKEVNEKEVYLNLKDIREVQKPKFNLGQLVRTVDIEQVFSEEGSTNYDYNLYTITEVIHDTNPSYRIKFFTREI